MSGLKYFSYEEYGVTLRKEMHYSQAVRVGENIEISGQGGWDPKTGDITDDLLKEIDQAFENVDLTLKDAGGKGWSQVFRIRLYAVDEAWTQEGIGRMVDNIKKWTPNHAPILTGVGVTKLGQPGMRVEVEVSAYDPCEPSKTSETK
ncbi:endoribonuclease L-PSP [Colletotrichum graminicola]|uniref:Endoribonuclease L-PSP n=1 Tax=Colletotrichum graminicola (strain M1.001 / M2 / FGSC 10212) TaxID=645133 RepID=E3QPE9_COLGM|nr:endoribonuclease L-PSP [Colletotrichum graminicola M1.001]EFQ32737.1 endoribonuclease L-PSP [Colletotrichum graminicola M1.001]WDK18040.1 endoribonuclease L-PSP [Colletotrichum graminicola]